MMRQEMSLKNTSINKLKKSLQKVQDQKDYQKRKKSEWYNLRPVLGHAN